jgi:carbon monoxide dehydrogenase subunit G
MELVNDFTVNAPIDEAWKILTDLERIAPCLPGAQLTEVEGDVYRGFVKVKVGPISAQFKGQATFVEKDEEQHKGTIKADGRDTTGKGNAAAFIHAELTPLSETSTKCAITTDLTITGKVAQFGRGALADVSTKLIGQFVENLEATVLADQNQALADGGGPEAPAEGAADASEVASEAEPATGSAATATVRKIEPRGDVQPVDLIDAAGAPLAKRLVPVGLGVILLWILLRLVRRR